MAWFGKIASFNNQNDAWLIGVEYFDDANPDKKISRSLTLPLTATKAEAIAAIKQKGVEVMRVSTINTEAVVGTVIPIP